MAQDIVNKLQTLSYTSKDFNSIYPELLNTVKQLTYKWDPSISNESDPGVLLLKLNAIIADKCNYNIDTSVLECFPLSVTQQRNARQLFEQLGYYMHWYNSATTTVALKWAGTIDPASSAKNYTIPAFTMITNADNNIVYTLIGPSGSTSEDTFIVQDTQLSTTGTTLALKAIEGRVVDYTVNGSSLITADMLDSNNRLYFSTSDVAENGIFIHNIKFKNWDEWKRKDNLLVETTNINNKFYKFGVAQDTATCYLEFPTNAAEIIQEGIYIKYIRSSGEAGNISYKILEKFYTNFSPSNDDSVTLSADNVKLYNISSGVGGSNFESINDAYKSYKTTVGTFNTLVTIRDYIDAFINNKLASNGFVCDRNNDIQSTYDIISSVGGINQHITQIDETTTNIPDLTAFSLKCYLLKYANLNTVYSDKLITDFETTFTPYTNSELYAVESYIEDMKLISHDYEDILATTNQKAHFCYFKNVYPLNMTITPQYSLSTEDKNIMRQNILSALYSALNATQINFGEEISLDLLLQTIQNADSRIKNISLNNVTYFTYAVYWDGNEYQSVLIEPEQNVFIVRNANGEILDFIIDEVLFTAKNNFDCTQTFSFSYNAATLKYDLNSSSDINLALYGITDKRTTKSSFNGSIIFSKASQFIDEIYAKSVLNGVTPFFIKDETYDYKLNQEYANEHTDYTKITTQTNISLNQTDSEYTLRENEYLQFMAPNFKNNTLYSNHVRYEYYIKQDSQNINAGSNYQLTDGEYVAFYWKESVDADTLYSYYIYGAGNYVCPSFILEANTSATTEETSAQKIMRLYGTPEGTGGINSPNYYSSAIKNVMTYDISSNLENLTSASALLSGSKNITMKQQNTVVLNAGTYCYWLLNNTTADNRCILFNAGETIKTLNENEYFIYSNENLEELVILGSGTKLVRQASGNGDNISTSVWEVVTLDYEKIFNEGSSALAGYWFYLPQGQSLQVNEQQILSLVPGMKFTMKLNDYAGTVAYAPVSGTLPADFKIDSAAYIRAVGSTATITKTFEYKTTETPAGWYIGSSIVGQNGTDAELLQYGITYPTPTEDPPSRVNFTVTYSTDWGITINNDNYTFSPSSLKLSNFSLYYESGVKDTPIDALIMETSTSSDSWNINSKLILDISPTKEQKLLANQSIILADATGTTTHTITGANESNNKFTKVLMANTDVLVAGKDQNIPTIYNINTGLSVPASFYEFAETTVGWKGANPDISAGTRVILGANEISFTFRTDDYEDLWIKNKLPAGDYIIPVTIPTFPSGITGITVSQNNTALAPIYDSTITNLTGNRIYYLYYHQDSPTNTINFKIAVTGTPSKDFVITVGNIYKFKYPDNLNNFIYTVSTDYNNNGIADFDETKPSYNVGDCVRHSGYYICKVAITEAESWDATKWELVASADTNLADVKAEIYVNKIKKLLIAFDPKHYYNYVYETPADNIIDNPIKSIEFFNNNHIYNEFTIAKYNAITAASAAENIKILG